MEFYLVLLSHEMAPGHIKRAPVVEFVFFNCGNFHNHFSICEAQNFEGRDREREGERE